MMVEGKKIGGLFAGNEQREIGKQTKSSCFQPQLDTESPASAHGVLHAAFIQLHHFTKQPIEENSRRIMALCST